MTTLAADKPRAYEIGVQPVFNDLPCKASDIIYEGGAVTIDASGNVEPLTTAREFAGFAEKKCDNAAGSAGDKNVHIRQQGIVSIPVTGASAKTHINDAVYATDDDAFTLTASGALQIGKVHRWVTSTTCLVFFQALSLRSV